MTGELLTKQLVKSSNRRREEYQDLVELVFQVI